MLLISSMLLITASEAEPLIQSTDQALALHVAEQGLDQLGVALQKRLPSTITIASGSGTLECSSTTTLTYQIPDWTLNISIDSIDFAPAQDQLVLEIYGDLSSDQIVAGLSGDCSIFEDLSESCDLALPTTAFSLVMPLSITLSEGELVVSAPDPVFEISELGNPVDNCLVADAVDTILGQNPALISDLIRDAIEPELTGLGATVEESLDGVIEELTISETLDVLDAQVALSLEPSVVEVTDNGLLFGFASEISGPVADCVDISSAVLPESQEWPAFDGNVFGSSLGYDAGIFLSRHFLEQLMLGVWASGGLCIDVAEQAGFGFTGEFAASFFGAQVAERFGESTMDLLLSPQRPPSIFFSDDQPPFSLVMDGLALEAYGPFQDREVRALRIDIAAEIGIELTLQSTSDGDLLSPQLLLSTDDFTYTEMYSDLLSPGYSSGVPGLIDLAMASLLSQAELPSLAVPSIFGVEFDALVWQPDENQDWLGGYVFLNTDNIEPFVVPSCSASDLGCDGGGPSIDIDIEEVLGCGSDDLSAGCEGGCSTAPASGKWVIRLPAGRLLLGVMLLSGVALRRRENR